jgi:hypothetical protein
LLSLGRYFLITEIAQSFGRIFRYWAIGFVGQLFPQETSINFGEKMDWATFWPIFLQTIVVTLRCALVTWPLGWPNKNCSLN